MNLVDAMDLTGATAFAVLGRGRYQVHIHDAFGFTADPPATFIGPDRAGCYVNSAAHGWSSSFRV